MAVTMEQIARQVGVSRGTVDRALHGRGGVKHEVAQKIKEVAKELGYKPNLAGKLLSDKKYGKHLIGIILVTENNPFFDDIISGAEAAITEFQEFGVSGVIRILVEYDAERQIQLMDELLDMGAQGFVMTPILDSRIDEKISRLRKNGVHVVTINSDTRTSDRLAYVGCRHKQSGVVMAELLSILADGREVNVAVLAGTEKNLAVTRRKQGFLEFLETESTNIHIAGLCANEDDSEISYAQTKAMLKEYENLDYLCVLGAGISGTIRAVKERESEHIPKLLVYDLIQDVKDALAERLVKATITQEPFRQGYDGVQIMAKYLAFGQHPENDIVHTKLAVVLSSCLA